MVQKLKLVSLNKDDKVVALKRLSEIYNTTGEMYNELKKNELTEEMKDMLFSLIESYTSEASKILKYDSQATGRILAKHADIRAANQRIHDLEKMLAENTQVNGLKELLYAMHSALSKWWRKQGFNLVTDDEFGSFGYKGRFCLDISHVSFCSRRPVTDKENHKTKIDQMIEDGYELELPESEGEYVILDTPINREKITSLVNEKFPSIKIVQWNNWDIRGTDKFRLRDFNAYIYDLNDLKNLVEDMKKVEDPEE